MSKKKNQKNRWNGRQEPPAGFKPGSDMPIALLADGHMLDLSHPDAFNLVINFLPPGALGCVTVACLQMRPGEGNAFCCVSEDIDEKSRVKFAGFLETIAKGLRHAKPGDIVIEETPHAGEDDE